MFALGVLILSKTRQSGELMHLLFGNILGVGTSELVFIGCVAVGVLLVLTLLHKELELASFDPDYADLIGLSPSLLRTVLLILLAFTVISCIYMVGVVLTSAMLITPAATASLLSRKLVPMMAVSAGAAVVTGVAGLYLSYFFDFAPGAAIVTVGTAIFFLVYIARLFTNRLKTGEGGA
jgi:manganese/iron transport system permease protein